MNEQILREGSDHLWQDEFPRIEANVNEGGMRSERKLATYEERLWWLGWSDGGAGQPPDDGIAIIDRHAVARTKLMLLAARGARERAVARLDALQTVATSIAKRFQSNDDELDQISARRRENPHDMSFVTGIAYVLVAIILLIADIPLSLNLVADAFHMPHTYQLAPGDVLTFSDLFVAGRRSLVLRYLWEPLVLALGIAALGIFFKLVSDYLLSTAKMLENWPRSLKVLKALFFGGACVLMVVGLVAVGQLRSEQQAITQAAERATASEDFSFNVGVAPTPNEPPSAQPTAPAAPQPPEASTATIAFVIMAIALPLIGGICFSVGWKRVQQSTRALWLRFANSVLLFRLARKKNKAGEANAEIASLSEEISQLEEQAANPSSTPLHVYLHGYARGFTAPQRMEPHKMLYSRCRELVHHWVATGLQEDNIKRFRSTRS